MVRSLLKCPTRLICVACILTSSAPFQKAEGQPLVAEKLIAEEGMYPIQSNARGWVLLARDIFGDGTVVKSRHFTLYQNKNVVAQIKEEIIGDRGILSIGEKGEIFLLDLKRFGERVQYRIEILAAPYSKTDAIYNVTETSSASQVIVSGNSKGQFAAIIDNHSNHPGGSVSAVFLGDGVTTTFPLLSESSRFIREVKGLLFDDEGTALVGINQYYREQNASSLKEALPLMFTGSIASRTFRAVDKDLSAEILKRGTSVQELSGGIALVSQYDGGSDTLKYVSPKTLQPISRVRYSLTAREAPTGNTTWTGSMSETGEFPIVEDRTFEKPDLNYFLILSPLSGTTTYSCRSFNHSDLTISRMGALGAGKFYALLSNSKDGKNTLYLLTRSVLHSEGAEVCQALELSTT